MWRKKDTCEGHKENANENRRRERKPRERKRPREREQAERERGRERERGKKNPKGRPLCYLPRPGVQVFPGTLGTSRRGASGRLCLTYGTQKMSFIDISISRHPAIYRRGERDARHSPIKALELLTLSLSE